jgi:hypothetical protein
MAGKIRRAEPAHEERSSFLKKRSKKLLCLEAVLRRAAYFLRGAGFAGAFFTTVFFGFSAGLGAAGSGAASAASRGTKVILKASSGAMLSAWQGSPLSSGPI